MDPSCWEYSEEKWGIGCCHHCGCSLIQVKPLTVYLQNNVETLNIFCAHGGLNDKAFQFHNCTSWKWEGHFLILKLTSQLPSLESQKYPKNVFSHCKQSEHSSVWCELRPDLLSGPDFGLSVRAVDQGIFHTSHSKVGVKAPCRSKSSNCSQCFL